MTERLALAEAIFHEVVEAPPEERAAMLAGRTAVSRRPASRLPGTPTRDVDDPRPGAADDGSLFEKSH